jgi:hypothetical protein
MKKIYAFLMMAGILIFSSCEQQETIVFEDEMDLLKSGNLKAKTILVEPAGPDYDTQNLFEAFAAAKENGPGTVILLAEGEFYLDQIKVNDFHGVFMGSGKNKTIIHTISGGINYDKGPLLFNFAGGDITVSDMSFEIFEDHPSQPFKYWTGEQATFLTGVIRIAGNSIENYTANSKFQNLSFTGKYVGKFDFTPYNIDNCILIGGGGGTIADENNLIYPLGGQHIIQNCEFNTTETAVNAIGLSYGNLTVGGSPNHANLMTNANLGILFIAGEHSNVKYSHNKMVEMQSLGGFYIIQDNTPPQFDGGLHPDACNFQIQNNTIELVGEPSAYNSAWPDGILMIDFIGQGDPAKKSNWLVQKNLFTLSGGYQTAFYSICTYNVNAIQNIIAGQSYYAFVLGGDDSGWDMKFNDFSNFESGWADIVLGSGTSNNKVICETANTSVADYGTDNVIKGPAERGKVIDISKYNRSEKLQHIFRQ